MRVVIIGGGVGGLVASVRLAKAGHAVTLLEQGERVGGKLNIWEPEVPGAGRFRFDTGPHVLTMPWAIQELFDDLGERMEDYLTLERIDPICRYHFSDGTHFDAPADPEEAARRIAQTFPGDEVGFRILLAHAKRVNDVTVNTFLRQDFSATIKGAPTFQQWRQLGDFIGLKPWETLSALSKKRLNHPRLRQIFDLYAFYNGSSPYKASSIYSVIAWVQWGEGTYYLRGGLRTYANALIRLAEKFGVTIRTGAKAERIIIEQDALSKRNVVRAVVVRDGDSCPADAVICNADPLTAYSSLIDPRFCPPGLSQQSREHLQPSTSAFLLLLGVQGEFPSLMHFNSFLPDDSAAEFDALFKRSVPADDPVIGVTCQSVTEPDCAPPGYSNLFVMTSPPPLSENFVWTEENTARYRERILTLLETRCGLKGLRDRIVCEQLWTPETFASRYGAWKGSLYGLSANDWRSAFLRPPNRAKEAQGLYFVGGGTHPGGGLPLVTLGGKIVVEAVREDAEKMFRKNWTP
jgi:phytoene desaturase